MQHIQHIIRQILHLLKQPFTFLSTFHLPFTKSPTTMLPFLPSRSGPAPPHTTTSTTIFSLPPELHFQILSYLPFTSHIALSSTHPFFTSLLQDKILRSQRYYTATYPGIHLLLKDYTLRLIIRNNDVKNAKIEVLQVFHRIPNPVWKPTPKKFGVLARLFFSTTSSPSPSGYQRGGGGGADKKKRIVGGILDDYWLWTSMKDDVEVPLSMDLKKLVVLLKINSPLVPPPRKEGDKDRRVYWSTEYPFRIARPTFSPTTTITNHTNSPSPSSPPPQNKKTPSNPTTSPPSEPATLKQILTFIAKRVIKEKGLKNEKEVRITLRVCKLGGEEGYVGFTGEVDVEGAVKGGGWGRWFGR
ncbi:hypothetical protein TWF506_000075 [Arthrobotrys conoides]|uniref:F-box domain-containing protein n=1 Tax=Arthrobotrys conoides TaxID=74498 RepID=A0AAN8RWD7_9PEZI